MYTDNNFPLVEIGPRNEQADLLLRAGLDVKNAEPKSFMVCSRALTRASPVFDRMLYGKFSEAKPTNPGENWTVDLPEDRPDSLELFVRIVHGYLNSIPRSMSPTDLYHLTKLTHYYDATPSLTPWIQPWISSLQGNQMESELDMPMLLWISWELGNMHLFDTTARRILMECSGSMFLKDSVLSGLQMPPDVIEHITTIRTQTVQSMLDSIREITDTLVVVDERSRWCHYATFMGPHRCESMILGSMSFCLTRAGLWPIPEAEDVNASVVVLYKTLMNLVIHDIGQPRKGDVDHSECNPREALQDKIKVIISTMPDPILDSHRHHFVQQIKKLYG